MALNFTMFLELLRPKETAGGLAISDSYVRFLSSKKEFKHNSLRLPPGVISLGKIHNKETLRAALFQIKNGIEPNVGRKVKIVLSLPPSRVFTQTFQLPLVAKENLKEAAEFNLKILSPLGKVEAYSDWQLIGEAGTQLDFIGAFAEKEIIDSYIEVLNTAGFQIIAIEFPATSVARVVETEAAHIERNIPYVVMSVDYDGLDFYIIKNGLLYFNYFHAWNILQDGARKIEWAEFEAGFIEEVKKVVNFNKTRWGVLEKFILITPSFFDQISAAIKSKFGLNVEPLVLKNNVKLQPQLLSAFGSSLRGKFSSSISGLSLESTAVRKGHFYEQLFTLVGFWRNITAAALFVLLISSIAALGLISTSEQSLLAQNKAFDGGSEEYTKLEELEENANNFNKLIRFAEIAIAQKPNWAPTINKIIQLAGPRIVLDQLTTSSVGKPIINISGTGVTESAISEFEKKLQNQDEFQNVSIPLTSIKQSPGGSVSFSLSMMLREIPR